MFFSESASETWPLRYGQPLPDNVPDLGLYMAHRSVRKFADTPVSRAVIQGLIASAQSASTSSNLQLWTAISVQDPERRQAIAKLCADQKQVHQAPWFFAFIADLNRLHDAAAAEGISADGVDYMEFTLMAAIDAALAAERMVVAAESLGLGCCYIGALRNDPEGVRDLLGLPPMTVGLFGLCVGFPAEDEKAAIKARLPQQAVWHEERYQHDPAAIQDYELRMADFYARRQLETTWAKHSGTRADGNHMTGRDRLAAFLHEQGLARR